MSRRKRLVLTILSLALLVLGVVTLISIVTALTSLRITKLHIDLRTNATHCVAIVHLSDLHVKTLYRDLLVRAVETTCRLRPDLVVITGDLIDKSADLALTQRLLHKLRQCVESRPIIAVLGNWEYWSGHLDKLVMLYKQFNVTLLVNDVVTVWKEGRLCIAGLDSLVGKPNTEQVLDKLKQRHCDIVVLLVHEPALAEKFIEQYNLTYPLVVLAGHTHCGQVALPLIGPLILPEGSGRVLKCGYAYIKKNITIHAYVSAGIGSSLMPVRLGASPELVYLEVCW